MKQLLFCLVGLIGYLAGTAASAHPEERHEQHQHRHQEYAKIKNPVPPTSLSVTKGRQAFESNCSSCHGEAGKGGIGPDLTDNVRIHGDSDGEIFHVISDGVPRTAMRGFKKELPEETRWHLVNYIRSLGAVQGR